MPATAELPEITVDQCRHYAARCRRCVYLEGVAFWEAKAERLLSQPNQRTESAGSSGGTGPVIVGRING